MEKVIFANEIANLMFSHILNVQDFFNEQVDLMHKKIFYKY